MIIKYVLALCWGETKCSAMRPGAAWVRTKTHRAGKIDPSVLEATTVLKTLNVWIIEDGQGYFR